MEQHYYTSIAVDATAHEAFENINGVTKWWTENLEGSSQKLNDEFTVRFDDGIRCRIKRIKSDQ